MVKTHLPQHMDSVRERLRPKHQILIAKCYPRLPKNSTASEVSPNSSELSYLLYYASTRRSKLHKVGAFLEKRTANDVYRWQSAKVMVTLQILTALLENKIIGGEGGFGLISPYVLRIIYGILTGTNDVGLIDASLSTWEVFCKHQDQATLAADHEYRALYERTVAQWAAYAQKNGAKRLGKSTTPVSVPDGIRLRMAGLGAVKALLTSDNLSPEVGRQLHHGIPAILTNIHSDNSFSLGHLLSLSKRNEGEEKEKDRNRRQSFATTRTFTAGESTLSDPRAAEGTTQDADAFAEEETAVFAVDCLKRVFDTDNRAQIRAATTQVLDFLAREQKTRGQTLEKSDTAVDWTSWSTRLFESITTWTPVQDRFIILVTATETLIRLPFNDDSVSQQLLFTQLIDDILRSDLNLIGLSVMDVLLLFIQQILRVLQLGSGSSAPRATATGDAGLEKPRKGSSISHAMQHVLLGRLKSCISDLATHVYYTDQIPDLISTLLLRLKPSASATIPPNPATTAAAIQEPTSAVTGSISLTSLARERSQSLSLSLPGGFFSFDTARQIALESVKDILIVANSSRSQTSAGMAASRNLVSLTVWEGTQWLLRDPAPNVRRAYVDALCTWLMLETRKSDARVRVPQPNAKSDNGNGAIARRAVSNASNQGRQGRTSRNTFLQLLHLAVYENALQHAATSEADILLLHLLLVSMSPRLGVNVVQSGLGMILALQEEIPRTVSPVGKIRLGSLVHGYLWQLVEQFELNHQSVGREILLEITRRKQHGMWMYAIGVPPTPLDRIPLPGSTSSTVPKISPDGLHHEALRPFDNRGELVHGIAESYVTSAVAATPATPSSPGRLTGPILDRHASSYLTAKQVMSTQLPEKITEAMLAPWSKESCLAIIAAAAPRDPSVTGSRSSPPNLLIGNHRQLLAAAGSGSSPTEGERMDRRAGSNQSHNGRMLMSHAPARKPSYSTFNASGDGKATLKVEELKRVLTGSANPVALIGRFDPDDDTGSESMVDVGGEDLSDAGSHTASTYAPRIAATGSSNRAGKAAVTNDIGHPVRNGSIISGRASMKSSRTGRQDLAALLDGMDLGDSNTRKYGNGRPPY